MLQRNDSITIMKALAIICMVAGHSYTRSPIENFVGLFHMPCFFICSGYCFKEKYLVDSRNYIYRKVKALWLPTVKWIVALVLLQNIMLNVGIIKEGFSGGIDVHYYDLKVYAKYIAMSVILHAHVPLFAGLWFIKMLLIASIGCFFVIKYCTKNGIYIVMGVLILLSIILLQVSPNHIPFIDQAHLPFLSSFFFLVGYLIRKCNVTEKIRNCSLFILSTALVLLIGGYNFCLSSMVSLSSLLCIPFCIIAISATLAMFEISRKLTSLPPPALKYITYMGNHTFSILMMHILSFKIVSALLIWHFSLPYDLLSNFPTIHFMTEKGFWIVYLIAGVNISLVCQWSYIISKHKWKTLNLR